MTSSHLSQPVSRALFVLALLVASLPGPLTPVADAATSHPAHDERLVLEAPRAGPVNPLPPVPQADPFFGIVQAIHDPFRAANAGARWERLVLWWSNMQPNGPQDWNTQGWFARNLIQDDRNKGIEPVGIVLHTPGWAARDGNYGPISPPRNLDLPFDHPDNYWGQFLMRLAGEYAGLVDTWILWNEPDIYRETYANWAGSVDDFARMQAVGYQAIKHANPRATVILAGTTYWWDVENGRPQYLDRLVERLLAQPGASENNGFFDAVSVHQYSNPLNSYAVPVLYRRILAAHKLDKPLWMDEANVPPYDDPLRRLQRGGLRASLEEQANYVIQSIALARAAGVARYAIYKMRDEEAENEQYYGLEHNDGSLRPAYVAYQTAARELANVSGAQYFWNGSATPPTEDEITALLSATSSGPQFVWPGALNGVRMRRGADRVTVLWNASAAPLQVAAPSHAGTATLIDKYGATRPLTRTVDASGLASFQFTLLGATNNTDARAPSLVLVGGDPLILVEPGVADAIDAFPSPLDACWGVPGALIPAEPAPAPPPVVDLSTAITATTALTPSFAGATPAVTVTGSLTVTAGITATTPVTATPGAAPVVQKPSQPASPVRARRTVSLANAWVAPTGYAVSGPWLDFFRSHGDVDYLGYPRSPVVADPLDPTQCIQYFQRVVLEWHPDNPPEYRIQRRLLATELQPGAEGGGEAPGESPTRANGADYWYFPKGERGLGYAVSNYAPDGSWTGFKRYFDRTGKEDAFGYPMAAPVKTQGTDGVERWTQQFQAAVFEAYPEYNKDGVKPGTGLPWRTWAVQLRLLGDKYLTEHRLPFIGGDPAAHRPVPPQPAP